MAENSAIEWTHHTFNPWRGCTKVSPGCAHCYAERQSLRNPSVLGTWGDGGTRVVAAESYWRQPLAWDRKAAAAAERHRVFCASMADVFEDRLELDAPRQRLFQLISATPALDWLLLTKRPENVLRMTYEAWCLPVAGNVSQNDGDGRHWQWPRNVWLGVSVEDQQRADERIPLLLQVPAAVRFLSCEPLLGPVDLRRWFDPKRGISGEVEGGGFMVAPRLKYARPLHWVIAGGESGPGARPMHPDWPRALRDQCQAAGVPFFFKQHGEWVSADDAFARGLHGTHVEYVGPEKMAMRKVGKRAAGRLLDGREWSEFPAAEARA